MMTAAWTALRGVSNPGEILGELGMAFTVDSGGATADVAVTGVAPFPDIYQNALEVCHK